MNLNFKPNMLVKYTGYPACNYIPDEYADAIVDIFTEDFNRYGTTLYIPSASRAYSAARGCQFKDNTFALCYPTDNSQEMAERTQNYTAEERSIWYRTRHEVTHPFERPIVERTKYTFVPYNLFDGDEFTVTVIDLERVYRLIQRFKRFLPEQHSIYMNQKVWTSIEEMCSERNLLDTIKKSDTRMDVRDVEDDYYYFMKIILR